MKFQDLKPGDYYIYNDELYQKIETVTMTENVWGMLIDSDVVAVRVKDGVSIIDTSEADDNSDRGISCEAEITTYLSFKQLVNQIIKEKDVKQCVE